MYIILMFGSALIRGVYSFHRCPYFTGVLILGVSVYQGCPYLRGVPISRMPLYIPGCPNFRGLRSRVSIFQECHYYQVSLYTPIPLLFVCFCYFCL